MPEDKKPLYPPRFTHEENNPFNGDLFERRRFAEQLKGYLDRLNDGTVVAIDAPWGEGKSWFGRNWSADLKSQDYRVVYLDAFKQDYVEDPFLLIASEINEVIGSSDTKGQELKQKAASVMKAILPFSAKMLLNVGGRVALGVPGIAENVQAAIEVAEDDVGDAAQKWVENKIESYAEDKQSLESFRDALQDFCTSQEKPVVFFIDELDRCRPDFSVKLIERLKHFFDVQNLVFVLLLNQGQLEGAVKGVYGLETDAVSYLRKFIHLSLMLPKNLDQQDDKANANWKYINELSKHYNFEDGGNLDLFITYLSHYTSVTGMSLRELEKCMALVALNGLDDESVYMVWPIILKIKYPELVKGILQGDKESHTKAKEILKKMRTPEGYTQWLKTYYIAYHQNSVSPGSMSVEEKKLFKIMDLKEMVFTMLKTH